MVLFFEQPVENWKWALTMEEKMTAYLARKEKHSACNQIQQWAAYQPAQKGSQQWHYWRQVIFDSSVRALHTYPASQRIWGVDWTWLLAPGLPSPLFLEAAGPGPHPCQLHYQAGLPSPCRAASTCCSLTSSSEFPSSYLDDRLEDITKKGKHVYLPNPYYCFSKKFSNSLLQPNSVEIRFLPQVTVIPLLSREQRTLSVLLTKISTYLRDINLCWYSWRS